jgi:polar amino acid transport system substrate-binding protein
METEFGALIRELKAGRFDVIAAGMYVLPERCAQISFSEPTYMATNLLGQGFAVRPGNPKGLHGYEDVARDGSVRLGVVAGGVEISHARALGVGDYQLVIFPDTAAAADGVRSGRVDAYAATALTVKALVDRDPKRLERAQPFRNPVIGGKTALGYGAFGFRKEDTDLLEAFNRHLLVFRGT